MFVSYSIFISIILYHKILQSITLIAVQYLLYAYNLFTNVGH